MGSAERAHGRLSSEASRAFWEGASFAERFFMGLDEVHKALLRLTSALEADGIPYAIAGAMALNAHGYRRVTTDADVLLTAEGLARFKEKHLADVQELIRPAAVPLELSGELDPTVRDKFVEIWHATRPRSDDDERL